MIRKSRNLQCLGYGVLPGAKWSPMRDSLGCVQLKLGTCILNKGGGITGRELWLEGGRGQQRRAEGFTLRIVLGGSHTLSH